MSIMWNIYEETIRHFIFDCYTYIGERLVNMIKMKISVGSQKWNRVLERWDDPMMIMI